MNALSLPCSTPEEQGVPSSAVLRFVEAVEKKHLELHSFMLLRHGVVVAEGWWEPYRRDEPHMLFSLSKSFTSSAVGLAVAERRISVDDAVISFFHDDLPPKASKNLAAMRIKHLLTMSTGHAVDTTERMHNDPEGNWVKCFLSLAVENQPGKPFVYNSGATYMLSAIVQKVTGMTVLEYLRPRLFEPLGITNPTWESCPRGINTGGWGLKIRTEDIARFGQMYLQKGMWNGARILPAEWVEAASRAQVSNEGNPNIDWTQGYGYQFWRCQHGAYRGDGAFGQYCIVMPEQDAVIAITSGVGDMQAVLNLVWKHLLESMRSGPLRRNPSAQEKLDSKLKSLALPTLNGAKTSPIIEKVNAIPYSFKENKVGIDAVLYHFEPDGCTFTLWNKSGAHQVSASSSGWKQGNTTLFSWFGVINPVVTNGVWLDEHRYVLTLQFYQTPFCWTITSQFNNDSIILRAVTNVSFGPTKLPRLVGRMKK